MVVKGPGIGAGAGAGAALNFATVIHLEYLRTVSTVIFIFYHLCGIIIRVFHPQPEQGWEEGREGTGYPKRTVFRLQQGRSSPQNFVDPAKPTSVRWRRAPGRAKHRYLSPRSGRPFPRGAPEHTLARTSRREAAS